MSFDHPWAFIFGLLGNILSGMVYLSPVPTFRRICKKKSTEGFQSFPYVVALFSAMQLIYYAVIKTNAYLIITVNTAGCIIELSYLTIYLIYAPKKAKINTIKWMLLLNVILFSLILLISLLFFKGADRVKVVGWFNMSFSVSVFAAPLSIIRLVIRTKSVEFMPFFLSFFLTMSAIAWFFYGLLTRDVYVATPNILGFTFGVIQMILYIVYKDFKKGKQQENKLPEQVLADIAKMSPVGVDVSKMEEENENRVGGNKRTGDSNASHV
ncbi:bidirectional sugar transporter SWEET14-like [Asparagus officinalis]|nr:bidirectional sugar transporter SWEET14-like [Asparagus officinalis]